MIVAGVPAGQAQQQADGAAGYQYGTAGAAVQPAVVVAARCTLAALTYNGTTTDPDAEENDANIAANTMTYNHRVGTMDIDKAKSPLKTKKAYLEFHDLCYTVMVGKEGGGTEPRMLLNNCFGFAKPGMMTALMGASGAGKSTLLDVLAGKKTGGTIAGSITRQRTTARLRRLLLACGGICGTVTPLRLTLRAQPFPTQAASLW